MLNSIFKTTLFGASMALATAAFAADESQKDPIPAPPSVNLPEHGVIEQSGVGGDVAYSRAGVMELGGSLNFSSAGDARTFSARPSLGYFFLDNWEISGIFAWTQLSNKGSSTNFFSVLAEPSFHLPFTKTMFGFLGAGFGVSGGQDLDFGVAFAPRVGMNFLVGRSGLFTPEISVQYSTSSAVATPQGTVIAVNSSFNVGAGYTVMW